MANPSKAQLLTDVQALLKKRYRIEPSSAKFTVLEAVVYAICHENATMAQADEAMAKFKSGFFDWNEVRVSSIDDLKAVFSAVKISDEEARANRLRRFLRQLFDKTYGFTLDALTKKPLKDSVKSLQEYEVFQSDYILAEVSRLALSGHAIGLDSGTLRVLERLGVGPTDADIPGYRASLERAVPKNRGAEFAELMAELASDVCLPIEPLCPECELRKICPTGQERLARPAKAAEAAPAATAPRAAGKASKNAVAEATSKEKPAEAAAKPKSGSATKSSAKPVEDVAEPVAPPKAKRKAEPVAKPPEKAETKTAPAKVVAKAAPKAEDKSAAKSETKPQPQPKPKVEAKSTKQKSDKAK